MEIRQLRYFLEVCKYNSISQAAQHIFISPQALSKVISSLEQEFKMPLFSRTSQGLVLTDAGMRLKELAQPIINSTDNLSTSMKVLYHDTQQELVVGVTSTLEHFLNRSDLVGFMEKHPPYHVTLKEYSHADCETFVANGLLSAALTYGPSSRPDVTCINILKRQRICLLPHDSPLAQKKVIHISDLQGCDFVITINDYCLEIFRSLCRMNGFEPKIYRVDDTSTMYQLCNEQGYVGVHLDFLLLHSLFRPTNLVALPICTDEFFYPVNLLINSTSCNRSIVRQLTDSIQQIVLAHDAPIPYYPFDFSC